MIICITFRKPNRKDTRVDLFVLPVSGSSSAVERQLPKLDVAGSIPVSRSIILPVEFAIQVPIRHKFTVV